MVSCNIVMQIHAHVTKYVQFIFHRSGRVLHFSVFRYAKHSHLKEPARVQWIIWLYLMLIRKSTSLPSYKGVSWTYCRFLNMNNSMSTAWKEQLHAFMFFYMRSHSAPAANAKRPKISSNCQHPDTKVHATNSSWHSYTTNTKIYLKPK